MELHADDRMLACATRHDLAVVVRRGDDAQRRRQRRRARSPASDSARPRSGDGRPAKTLDAVVGDAARSCRASAGRRARSRRRRPRRCTDGRGRRRGSGSSAPKRRTRSVEMPASAGVHGPGRDDDVARRERRDLVERDRVVAAHDRLLAQLAHVAGEVVDERVVVVDEQDHARRAERVDHAARLVERLAVLLLGIGVGHDAAAGAEVYAAVARDRGADRDAGVDARRSRSSSRSRRSRRRARDGSSSAMISMARTFGAPVIEPPGKAARSRSSASRPGAQLADDGRDQVVHGGVALEREELRHAHACPARHTRDRSLRSRSTIIRFSARSFALSVSAWPSAASCSGPTPRGARALDRPRLDVAAGVDAQEALGRRAEHRARPAKSRKAANGAGLLRAQAAVERPRRLGERRLEALRQVRLEDVAGEDVLAHARRPRRGSRACVNDERSSSRGSDHARRASTGYDGASLAARIERGA